MFFSVLWMKYILPKACGERDKKKADISGEYLVNVTGIKKS